MLNFGSQICLHIPKTATKIQLTNEGKLKHWNLSLNSVLFSKKVQERIL